MIYRSNQKDGDKAAIHRVEIGQIDHKSMKRNRYVEADSRAVIEIIFIIDKNCFDF